jgi:hypothetical protein
VRPFSSAFFLTAATNTYDWIHTKGSEWRCAKYLQHQHAITENKNDIPNNSNNKNDPNPKSQEHQQQEQE